MKCLNFLGWLGWRFGRLTLGLLMIAMGSVVIGFGSPILMQANCNGDLFKFMFAGVLMAFGPDDAPKDIL